MEFLTKDNINTKKYILLGEVHGVRENVVVVESILNKCVNDGFTVKIAFEWLLEEEQERVLNEFITNKIEEDQLKDAFRKLYSIKSGAFSDQHLDFLCRVREINEENPPDKQITVVCFDTEERPWDQRDKTMAETILEKSEDVDKVIIVTGSLHARKKQFFLENDGGLYKPLALYLPQEQIVSVKIHYDGGQFYNFGLQNMPRSNVKNDTDIKYYDETCRIKQATPVTLTLNAYT